MIIESAVLVGSFLVTAFVGVPLAGVLARPRDWLGDGKTDGPMKPDYVHTGVGFEPLDLGPVLMSWPSEVERPSTGLPEPEWPSKGWDDPHFGAHWDNVEYAPHDDAKYEAMQAQRRQALKERREHSEKEHQAQRARSRAETVERGQRSEQESQRGGSSPEQEFFRENVTQKARGAAQNAKRQAAEAARAAKQKAAARAKQQAAKSAHKAISGAASGDIPSPAELEAMVGQLGLAGTVQEIMKRTNWDFRKAAHYLAKARQSK